MDIEVYANLFGTPYTILTEPGPYDTHEDIDTAAARADANAIHKE